MAKKDYTGQRFGSLTVLAPHSTDGRRWFWTARCDCGTEKIVQIDKLAQGRIVSCGCGPRRGGDGTGRRKWGRTYTPDNRTYRSWSAMINRCTNPNVPNFKRYGAAGIKVCDRWSDFNNFLADMGERPEGKSLDRWPDPYGNYEPGNCRWATAIEQANNRRKHESPEELLIKINGLILGFLG